ncbi:YtkA-like protein [Mesorhizobium sp. J18]|uniref:FixH family protein n=1 Tax=Mesorhizobium sp. J18 TaxID=935263 RepID=UPI00119B08F8|nr:FixH family protein [Mesorhizobium sp. J18]TWH01203.1 YtkA-like protein [Mesorhizobium sp. J18]
MKWPSRRVVLLAAALLAIIAIGMAAMHLVARPPDDLDLARSKSSANGIYAVSIEPEAEPVEQGKLHSWLVSVTMADGSPATDAIVSIDGGMPEHGHGLPTAPQVTGPLPDGRYRIEGVRFNMGGWWELRFSILSPAGDDEVVFNIVL